MENNFKHTPGPWKVEQMGYPIAGLDDTLNKSAVQFSGNGWDGFAYAHVKTTGDTVNFNESPEGIANAKLIAAAPELLEACIMALDNLHNGEANTKYRLMEVLQTLEEAIKKATE